MSKKNAANIQKHKKKLNDKKRKIQEAEATRKKRLKEIRQQFNDQPSNPTH